MRIELSAKVFSIQAELSDLCSPLLAISMESLVFNAVRINIIGTVFAFLRFFRAEKRSSCVVAIVARRIHFIVVHR